MGCAPDCRHTGISQSLLFRNRKIQDLCHSGLRATLPKICVIGDQTAGKISVIQSIAKIELPPAQSGPGCPLEINLLESDEDRPWTCKIYRSRNYSFDQLEPESQLQSKLSPWRVQSANDEHFVTLHDKADIRDAIRWAQAANLNPGRPSADYRYVPGRNQPEPSWQAQFSPNVVRLDISGPDVPTRSLCDLPSVSAAANVGEKSLVAEVEKLIKDYIDPESRIVLLVLPMTSDSIQSAAPRVWHLVPDATKRTIGVLTEPDRDQSVKSYTQWN